QGGYFVFRQGPSAQHFGLEEGGPHPMPPIPEWSKLSWGHFAADQDALDKLSFAPATVQPTPVAIEEAPPGDPDNPGDASNAWGQDAAQTAFITLRRPARVAIHAEMMLPDDS